MNKERKENGMEDDLWREFQDFFDRAPMPKASVSTGSDTGGLDAIAALEKRDMRRYRKSMFVYMKKAAVDQIADVIYDTRASADPISNDFRERADFAAFSIAVEELKNRARG